MEEKNKQLQEFIKQSKKIHNDKYDYSLVKLGCSRTKIKIICPIHGEFEQIPYNHLKNFGCSKCGQIICGLKKRVKLNDFIDRAKEKHGDKYDYSLVNYNSVNDKIKIICPTHGEFEQVLKTHMDGAGCSKCSNNFKSNTDEFINKAKEKHGDKYDYSLVNYTNSHNKIKIICPIHGEFEQSPKSHLKGHECNKCNGNILLNINEIIKRGENIHKNKYDYSISEYIGFDNKINIVCPIHGQFEQLVNNHLQGKGCKKCAIKFDKTQKNIYEFITTILIDGYIMNDTRKIIPPLELDIYIPSHKLAIEYNGVYWHSEEYKPNDYHLNKTIECEKQGIQLIHIFEDEWLFKQDIVKSRLQNILGLTPNKIYARKCEMRETSSRQSKEFLNENHIQGNVNSKIKLGLYYNDELVSLMTFGSLRKVLGNKHNDDSYELLRFCNKLNTTIIGGADKLFKYFIKTYKPIEIISYADRRWSQGNLYEKLGFKFIHNSKPNYFYIINKKREYRFKYRKDVLVKEGYDSSKSERQIMLDRGINRIYDCGNKKYVFKC